MNGHFESGMWYEPTHRISVERRRHLNLPPIGLPVYKLSRCYPTSFPLEPSRGTDAEDTATVLPPPLSHRWSAIPYGSTIIENRREEASTTITPLGAARRQCIAHVHNDANREVLPTKHHPTNAHPLVNLLYCSLAYQTLRLRSTGIFWWWK